MAISKKRKLQLQQEITRFLQAGDVGDSIGDLKKRYKDVSNATFFRYLKECREAMEIHIPAEAIADARALAIVREEKEIAEKIKPLVSKRVAPQTANALPTLDAIGLLEECISHGREVIQFCRTADGKVRNLKGLLAASAHMRASVDTLARVIERVNDAKRINGIMDAMVEEINKEDPKLARRVLLRIQSVIEAAGL